MGVEQFFGGKKNGGALETFKTVDKIGLFGGIGVYLLVGVPAALAFAALSGASWGATELGEKLYKKWKDKVKGK